MSKILVLGGTSYDTIVQLDKNPVLRGTFFAKESYERCGSTGTAKATALKKLGAEVTLHTVLGDDEAARAVLECLESFQLPHVIDYYEGATDQHINILDQAGNRISLFMPNPMKHHGIEEDRLNGLIQNSDIIVLNILDHYKPYLHLLKGRTVWTDLQDYLEGDPYYDEFIEAAQVIFMSSERLIDYRSTMRRMGAQGKLIVATHGKEGSTAFQDGRYHEQDAHDFVLVDSDGAGDNFFAGFLVEYIKKHSLERSLMTASVAGGLSIETRELVPSDLTYEMLERTMIERGIR